MTDAATQSASGAITRLRNWLAHESIDGLVPLDVQFARREDADGRDSWFIVVTLPTPAGVDETWPVDSVMELQRHTRDKALELGVEWPWHLIFEPEHDQAAEEEDDLGTDE